MNIDTKDMSSGFLMSIVKLFLESRMSIILLITSLLLGISAIILTPKEEEPQIVVPIADIIVQAPGASAEEVEKLVATPLEKLLWQTDGVEYVYSVSRKELAIVTARFYVGENETESLVRLHNKIMMNRDIVPPIVKDWVVQPVSIDDVPIVNITLYSTKYDDHVLERTGEEVLARLAKLENISKTLITGGRPEELRIEVSPEKLESYQVSLNEIINALKDADISVSAGDIPVNNSVYSIESNSFLHNIEDVKSIVVGVKKGRPVYLNEIAEIMAVPAEAETYSRIGFSKYFRKENKDLKYPESASAVTLALAKKKGTNAVLVADSIIKEVRKLEKEIIPDGVRVEITRNYGATASEKVNSLLGSLGFAVLGVVILLAFTIGKREAFIVAVAVPVSFSLALFCNYLFGYTINRVTLFALILSLGLVVDDPITNVDNIQRHLLLNPENPVKGTLEGVGEVLTPVVMSTLAIIVCFVPLSFITGMMGPYMAPMAINVPLTVTFSTLCAITIVPFISLALLKNSAGSSSSSKGVNPLVEKVYRKIITPFLDKKYLRYVLLVSVIVLFFISCGLAVLKLVPLKLLPFDNKNEFQVVVDMPEGTTLEQTNRVVKALESYLDGIPEVTNFVSYIGESSPIDFNGMVRHSYLRKGSNLADIRVNLVDKKRRKMQSHGFILRIRNDIKKIGNKYNAKLKLVEVPPGPPVISTIVAEIYGENDMSYGSLINAAKEFKKTVMKDEPGVVEIDDMSEKVRIREEFIIDKEKAAIHGVSTKQIASTLKIAVGGLKAATLHKKGERQPYSVRVILPLAKRAGVFELLQVPVKGANGKMIPLAELVSVKKVNTEQPIYHKNLERVVYVTSEMAGRAPGEAILSMMGKDNHFSEKGIRVEWAGEGEWKITLRVFRDMGIAFAAALLAIYIILIIQSNSFFMPLLIMMAIPLTILGIMPGFFLLNIFAGENIGGYYNPVFFTATSMIGMIALGGIVIRNSLVLIEFIQEGIKNNMDLREAILESGAIRFRPIILTALTTAIGAYPITFDPVFSGLAWALIFGITASTVFTLLIVPVTYYGIFYKKS
ncbi:MAG: acriflavine resistance protein B [Gammaproteobacteria bacterium]|nr:MAG: acriflavine resistance protein B [Deltaproteobacteria bacterium]PIE48153.1 MAG: acriflavine resistance protein B [Gammaproteobacteria bacterium]